MRRDHLLSATKADCYPSQVVCIEVERLWSAATSGAFSQVARLVRWVAVGFSGAAGVYGKDHWCEGTTAEEFWGELYVRLKKKGSVSVYCADAGTVSALLGLWESVESRRIILCGNDERSGRGRTNHKKRPGSMRCVLESPPFIVEGRMTGLSSKFKILDVENYGIQLDGADGGISGSVRRIAAFVRGMVAALKDRQLGSLKDTVGTQAMYSFRRRHLTHMIHCHDNQQALNLESDSYYGGRCEAFRIGRLDGPVYHVDVSSMYPYVASQSDVPVSLVGHCGELGAGDQPQLGEGCGIIADVLVETDEPCYPHRNTERGITVWPVGVFRTTLSGPELRDALSHDRVIRWYRASWYLMAPALASFSRCALDMRSEYSDNADLKAWSKALGVCLIGKLGQKDRYWKDAESNVMHGPWQTWWEHRRAEGWKRYRSISNYTQAETISSWSYDASPAVASWVTSLARVRLLTLIRCASWPEVYYCDTDALMVSRKGFVNLERAGWVRDGEPGFLLVKNVSGMVEIHGVKSYDEEGRSVSAGRPLSVASNDGKESRYWTKRSAAVACHEMRAPQAVRVAIPFRLQDKYRHGEVCADGQVIPFQLNEG